MKRYSSILTPSGRLQPCNMVTATPTGRLQPRNGVTPPLPARAEGPPPRREAAPLPEREGKNLKLETKWRRMLDASCAIRL